ncbi:MAG: Uncharacterised protein [Alphaproteobacteria bacterium UBA4588]|nr:MAG: Uncharacterised protein [Alphaproteobacteria bacterium UBA4588]
MNRTECALQMRKISVADPVIYGVFVLAAGILMHHMMLNPLKPFTSLPYSPSIISGIFLCSAICLFYQTYIGSPYRLVSNKTSSGLAEHILRRHKLNNDE